MHFYAFFLLTRNENRLTPKDIPSKGMKVYVLLDCPTISSEEFAAVDDDNVCTASITAGKDILEFVQRSKNIIGADSDDENKMNKVAPAPTSAERSFALNFIKLL
ncbi:SCAN domain-containing protein 3 [Trichonephila clavipes]|uniref:SCAN domain-containing protein 3 n=1 Tax=Trichonephila clavipes TaxID=2585209 RepID=A0A8X6V8L8_TRICX|nr:SCAN domain-containing protein 3 [Trichonephila clavipes]